MPSSRLPETVQTLYAELLDQLRAGDAEAAVGGMTGTFVSKEIRGRTYWYLQRSEGASKRQIYLGRETPELLERMDSASAQRAAVSEDEKTRRELISMLEAGGMFRESAAIGVVLRVLSEASVFRAGGVLVGTQAFTSIANMLGVSFDRVSLRTADIDVAHDGTIPLGLTRDPEISVLERLKGANPAFFAVPELDPREPSTSFKVRGRDLRVDFLTPAAPRSRSSEPVYLRHLGVAAQPLPGLDYLIEANVDAAVVVGTGVLVNVPRPGRFALHKLWVSTQRPSSEAAKARKDIRQAEQLLEVLIEDRPDDVSEAWSALNGRKSLAARVKAAIGRLDPAISEGVKRLL